MLHRAMFCFRTNERHRRAVRSRRAALPGAWQHDLDRPPHQAAAPMQHNDHVRRTRRAHLLRASSTRSTIRASRTRSTIRRQVHAHAWRLVPHGAWLRLESKAIRPTPNRRAWPLAAKLKASSGSSQDECAYARVPGVVFTPTSAAQRRWVPAGPARPFEGAETVEFVSNAAQSHAVVVASASIGTVLGVAFIAEGAPRPHGAAWPGSCIRFGVIWWSSSGPHCGASQCAVLVPTRLSGFQGLHLDDVGCASVRSALLCGHVKEPLGGRCGSSSPIDGNTGACAIGRCGHLYKVPLLKLLLVKPRASLTGSQKQKSSQAGAARNRSEAVARPGPGTVASTGSLSSSECESRSCPDTSCQC